MITTARPAPRFEDIKRSIADIRANEDDFLADFRYDIALGVKSEPGLIWKPVAKPSNEAYFALKSAGFTPMLCDFEEELLEELAKHPALFVVCDEVMDAAVQEKLLRYAEAGSRLILSGMVPNQNRQGEPCTLLADASSLGIKPSALEARNRKSCCLTERNTSSAPACRRWPPPPAKHSPWSGRAARPLSRVPLGKGEALALPFAVNVVLLCHHGGDPSAAGEARNQTLISGARQLRILPKANGGTSRSISTPFLWRRRCASQGRAGVSHLRRIPFEIFLSASHSGYLKRGERAWTTETLTRLRETGFHPAATKHCEGALRRAPAICTSAAPF